MTDQFDARMCRTARAWLGMTQWQLAKKADVGTSTVADFERGARDTDPHIVAKLAEALSEFRVVGALLPEQVEWIVNDIAELGVKIGGQFFFCYKGRSLVYEGETHDGVATHDDGSPMHWRLVHKREFGECIHPINYADLTKIGTVSLDDDDDWQPLPAPLPPGEQKL